MMLGVLFPLFYTVLPATPWFIGTFGTLISENNGEYPENNGNNSGKSPRVGPFCRITVNNDGFNDLEQKVQF